MNLFRSEEHARKWRGFKPQTEAGINKLSAMAELFSGNLFTRRLDPDYASKLQSYFVELVEILKGMGPYWRPAAQ